MIELTRKTIKLRDGETIYEVRVPNAREIKEMQAVKETDIDQSIGLLEKLGLPSAVGWELGTEKLQEIFEALMPSKKS